MNNIDHVPTAVPDTNKACIICRAKNKEDAADCAASLALCSEQPIFTTICAGLCDDHRKGVVQSLSSMAKQHTDREPLSLDMLPKGDPRVLLLKLREYDFPEVMELYLRVLQSNALPTDGPGGRERHASSRSCQAVPGEAKPSVGDPFQGPHRFRGAQRTCTAIEPGQPQ